MSRYEDITPSLMRRILNVWIKSQTDTPPPVLLRVPDESDDPPFYLINWSIEDQNNDMPFMRKEQIDIYCITTARYGEHGMAAMKIMAIDFFQREYAIDDCNRIVEYIEESEGIDIPYRFKSIEVLSSGSEIKWSDDGQVLESVFSICYDVTYAEEELPHLKSLTDEQLGALDA